ncbi:hypothetical protein POVWA2_053090 [Plasmodium ovale wallikeri]|uniref:Uncharacterized protein n=1 Tax=Plasmodium ovale wallikeri TaxID=864142 RepID=A0A1A8ZSC5_PLAOA|nr:hypothetical protein POVWA1_053830 [Plasmodium ovale wallikeri]SBT47024.1 hypothetical protein POVWA2_053090 [Plasmodium ovale wallikeri]
MEAVYLRPKLEISNFGKNSKWLNARTRSVLMSVKEFFQFSRKYTYVYEEDYSPGSYGTQSLCASTYCKGGNKLTCTHSSSQFRIFF